MDNLEKELRMLQDEPVMIPETVLNKVDTAFATIRRTSSRKKKAKIKKKYILAATILLVASLAFSPSVRAAIGKIIFSFENKGIETAVSNEYYQKVDNVEFEDDNVGLKLENFLVDSSKIAFDFVLDKKKLRGLQYNDFGSNNDMIFEMYDENDNVLLKMGSGATIKTYSTHLEKEMFDKPRIKVLFESPDASIPDVSKLKVKITEFSLTDKDNNFIYNEKINWNFDLSIDDKMKSKNRIEYSYKANNSNIEVRDVKILPTGVYLEYAYFPKEYGDDVMIMAQVKDNNGEPLRINTTSVEIGELGEMIISGTYNGITSFENIDKFTLEIPNPDGQTVDKVEFTQNK